MRRLRIDESRRALAQLHAIAERLAQAIQRLDAEVAAEREAARASFEVAFGFPLYASAARERREQLSQSAAQIAAQIAAATEEIANFFRELKRYELAQADRDQRARAQSQRAETAVLDEVAATRFANRARSA
jgi:hypothetical protein